MILYIQYLITIFKDIHIFYFSNLKFCLIYQKVKKIKNKICTLKH